jgi:hypothetical protein
MRAYLFKGENRIHFPNSLDKPQDAKRTIPLSVIIKRTKSTATATNTSQQSLLAT